MLVQLSLAGCLSVFERVCGSVLDGIHGNRTTGPIALAREAKDGLGWLSILLALPLF